MKKNDAEFWIWQNLKKKLNFLKSLAKLKKIIWRNFKIIWRFWKKYKIFKKCWPNKKKTLQMFGNIFMPFWKKFTKFWKKKLDKIIKIIWLNYFENNMTELFCRKFYEIFRIYSKFYLKCLLPIITPVLLFKS